MKPQTIYTANVKQDTKKDKTNKRKKETQKSPLSLPVKTVPIPPKTVTELQTKTLNDEAKQAVQEEIKLNNLTKKSQHVLFKCSAVFPFQLFPDEISVEPTQINIKKRLFFLSSHLLTIPIDNISDVHVHTIPFFASLRFIDRSFVESSIQVRFLKVGDAEKIRQIVQGLIIAKKEKIAIEKISPDRLTQPVQQLGNMAGINER